MLNKDTKNLDYYESRERWAMNALYENSIKPKFIDHFIPELYLTPTNGKTNYDAILYLRDKVTTNILFKFIIEIKYRDNSYESLMLEKKKYNNLLKSYKEAMSYKGKNEDIGILYIVFSQMDAYIFNLQSPKLLNYITNKGNLVSEKHNKTTYIKNDIKVKKDVYYLPNELGRKFIIPSYIEYKLMYELNKAKFLPKIKETINTYSIF